MMTLMERAKQGEMPPPIVAVAADEGLDPEVVRRGVAEGTVCIPLNARDGRARPTGIGRGLRTKVNANIGTSVHFDSTQAELCKARVAIEAGADTVMDLSTGRDVDGTLRAVREACDLPLGTVPIYQAAIEASRADGGVTEMTPSLMFDVIERHAKAGVDFMTLHCGVTRESVTRLKSDGRLTDIVSRGGAFLARWIIANGRENPLYENFDDLLELAREYDFSLSLGDGLRPGCLADATDRAQVQETIVLGELVERARAAGVQAFVEGPGHVPMDQIAANVLLEKRLCKDAPFYVLGPLVTDVAPGYDHISGAIGGALAAAFGADFLCYVTPTEHVGLPTPADVREGVIAARIAAHAADIAKGVPGARQWDDDMARARRALDWERQASLAIDPARFRELRRERTGTSVETCSMCGDYCPMREQWLQEDNEPEAAAVADSGV